MARATSPWASTMLKESSKEKAKTKVKVKSKKEKKPKGEDGTDSGYFRLSGKDPEPWELVIPQTKVVLGRSGSAEADVHLGDSSLVSR